MSTSAGDVPDRPNGHGYDDLDPEERAERLEAALLGHHHLAVLGTLVPRVAHDLRNELMVIEGNAAMAAMAAGRTGAPGDSRGGELAVQLAEIRLAAGRAAALVEQLRRTTGHGSLALVPVAMAGFLEQLHPLLTLVAPVRVTVRLEQDPCAPTVMADVDRLRELIVELVANAADAIGDAGGTITVRTRTEEGRFALEVIDDGPGVDPDHLDRLAEPLFSTRPGHLGLGLTVVEDTLLAFDGALDVESSAAGTTVRISLPVAASSADPARPTAPAERSTLRVDGGGADAGAGVDVGAAVGDANANAEGRRRSIGSAAELDAVVLVVDDDDSLRMLVRRVLTPLGLTIIEAADGDAALLAQQEHGAIDLVILDLTMPGRDGDEVFRALRAEDPHLAVLVLTGYSSGETEARFPQDEGVRIIHKPFDIHELRALVTAALPASARREGPAR